ncbi:MAG: transporter, family, tetracycline resistance protein [Ilumatobacteraceae bacterium]|jgi:MFS family permease
MHPPIGRTVGDTGGMRTRSVVVVFGTLTGLFASGYGVMFTVLDEFRDQYGISEGALGLIVAMGFLSSFVAQVTIAPLADRGHARLMIVLGMVFNVAGLLGMAYGSTVMVLLFARFVMGTGVGLAYPAARRIVILADPEHLGQNLGRMLAADVTGFAVGPAISAVLVGPFGIAAPFLLIAVMTVAIYPLIARTRVADTDVDAEIPPRFAFDLLRIRPYLAALAMGAAVFMMIGTFDALWALVLDDLHASDLIANLGITLFAVPMVLFASIGGRWAQTVGPFRLGTFGLLVGAAAMFAYGHAPSGGIMLAISIVHATNDGFTVSSCGVAVGLVVQGERQASAQGLLGGVQTLVAGISATAIGQIYQHFGRTAAYSSCAVMMVALVVCSAVLSGTSWRLRDTTTQQATVSA